MKRAVVLLLYASSLAFPQGRDFFPWWDMPVARDLNLSEEQTNRIQSIVREYRDRLIDLRATMEKVENQVADLINEDQPDTQKVNAAIDRSVQARADLSRAFSQMAFRIRLVLTPQQWKELQKRRPQPGGMPGMMRPGGLDGGPRMRHGGRDGDPRFPDRRPRVGGPPQQPQVPERPQPPEDARPLL